ncbi:hypothetical protein JCM9279_003158 [Rhodotorula babjevae]
MCRPTQCANESCGKTTWIGCGLHIPYALRDVAPEDQCTCKEHNPTPLPPRQGAPPDYAGWARAQQW